MEQKERALPLWLKVLIAIVSLGGLLTVLVGLLLAGTGTPEGPHVPPTTLPPPAENVFTPEDFGYEGDYLTCLTDTCVLGTDVSSYQGEIDWEQVKAAGFEFVMIRAGYRGYGRSGKLMEDKQAQENYEGAKAAGLQVGAYFFSQALNVEEAEEEAEFVMEIIEDWELDMPLAFDWECLKDNYRTVDVDPRTLTDCAKAFCNAVGAQGYDPMVYFNPSQSRKDMYLAELTDFDFWLAMYSENMNYDYKVDMWQYTNKGKIPGIKGNADINLYFPYE